VLPKPYERESYYLYSPIGGSLMTNLGKGWSLEETAEFDYFWWDIRRATLVPCNIIYFV